MPKKPKKSKKKTSGHVHTSVSAGVAAANAAFAAVLNPGAQVLDAEILSLAKAKPPEEPDDTFIKLAVRMVRSGCTPDVACRNLGLPSYLYRTWVEKGLKDMVEGINSRLAIFVRAMDIADAEDERADMEMITIGVKHAKALQWKRSKKSARRWGTEAAESLDEMSKDTARPPLTYDNDQAASILKIMDEAGALRPDDATTVSPVINTTATVVAPDPPEKKKKEDKQQSKSKP